jgi:hypothetical protein
VVVEQAKLTGFAVGWRFSKGALELIARARKSCDGAAALGGVFMRRGEAMPSDDDDFL